MIKQSAQLEQSIKGIQFAQRLPPRPVYSIKNLGESFFGSTKTAHRRIKLLEFWGLATYKRGKFQIKREVVTQPLSIFKKLFSSLESLKNSRRFGRSYNNADINFVLNSLHDSSIVTLDHRAWDLTKYQFPNDLFIYVDDIEKTTNFLKKEGLSEGNKGHVVILAKTGSFDNEIERVYLDCIANGGRSIMDAIALQLRYPEKISIKARFPIELMRKVQQDLPIK